MSSSLVPTECGLYGFAQHDGLASGAALMSCNCFGVLGLALQSCWRDSSECVGFDSRGLLFALLCIAAIAAVCKTVTFDTSVVRVHHGALVKWLKLPIWPGHCRTSFCVADLDVNYSRFGMLAEWINAAVPKAVAL